MRSPSDDVWPLRLADGRTFAERKAQADLALTVDDVIGLFAATFDLPREQILQQRGRGRAKQVRMGLTVALVRYYDLTRGEHVPSNPLKAVARWLGCNTSSVEYAQQRLPVLRAKDPEFADALDALGKVIENALAK